MHAPHAKLYRPDPDYLRALIHATGLTQAQAAIRIGASPRMMRSYLSHDDETVVRYPVQYALEALAFSIAGKLPIVRKS